MQHGGEIYGLSSIQYDFSVNINPLGVPGHVLDALREGLPLVERYPDQYYSELKQALSEKLSVPDNYILCGNGASELIQAAVNAVGKGPGGRVLLTAPCFSGYERAVRSAGKTIDYFYLNRSDNFAVTREILPRIQSSLDLLILCSPSNPVGNTIESGLLLDILQTCREKDIPLLLDECFLGFLEDGDRRSMRKYLKDYPNLLIVDAFTKRYALPGIRLGYLLCSNQELLKRIQLLQAEWSVSSLAQIAGVESLKNDEAYLKEARDLITEERSYLEKSLSALGFQVYRGEANYMLFETHREIFDPLIKAGFLIRHCDNYEGLGHDFYRIAIKGHSDNEKLIQALKEICR